MSANLASRSKAFAGVAAAGFCRRGSHRCCVESGLGRPRLRAAARHIGDSENDIRRRVVGRYDASADTRSRCGDVGTTNADAQARRAFIRAAFDPFATDAAQTQRHDNHTSGEDDACRRCGSRGDPETLAHPGRETFLFPLPSPSQSGRGL